MLIRPPRSRCFRLLFAALVYFALLAALPCPAAAQSAARFPQDDNQVWGDWYGAHPLGEGVSLGVDGGLRAGSDAGHLIYRRIGVSVSFRLRKYLTVTPSYHFYQRDSAPARESRENRLSLAATATLPLGRWGVSDRNLLERHFLARGNSWRYRNRMEVVRHFAWRREKLRAFAWDEVFYDSSVRAWSRNRVVLGAGKSLSPRLSLDIYFLRQNDSFSRPADLNTLGIAFHTRL
jgi:Protein of unknown function (DUF2490)